MQSEFFRRAIRHAQRLALAALAGCFLQSQAMAQNSTATSAMNWSGFHAGVHGGYHAGGARMHFDPTFFNPNITAPLGAPLVGIAPSSGAQAYIPLIPSAGASLPGRVFGGLQLGYDWQMGNFVVGLVGDLSYMNGRAAKTVATPYPSIYPSIFGDLITTTVSRMNWLGTIRGRFGYASDRTLYFVTGGAAAASASASYDFRYNNPIYGSNYMSLSPTIGWTAGAGVEFAATSNWAVKGEYLYYRLGTKSDLRGFPDFTPRVRHEGHILRMGVNYRFN